MYNIQRWYVDGTVECFVGEHAPLAIFAILVLTLCTLFIVLMTAIVMRKIKVCMHVINHYVVFVYNIMFLQKYWAISMSNILKAPFTDNLYWWAPIDLLRRPLFVMLIVISPGNLVSIYY